MPLGPVHYDIWGSVNRLHSTLLISVLLVTGCGSGGSSTAAIQSEPAQTVATSAVQLETPQNTCRALFNTDEGNLHETTSSFLIDVTSLDKDTAAEAEELSAKLAAVANTADDELAPAITKMRAPLDEFVYAWDTNGTWSLDIAHKAAFEETIAICGRYFPPATQSSIPEPTALPTTGDFMSDALALNTGIEPSVIEIYDGLGPTLCEPTLSPDTNEVGYAIEVAMWRDEGRADDILRLVMQYNCPDKLNNLEAAFTRLDD